MAKTDRNDTNTPRTEANTGSPARTPTAFDTLLPGEAQLPAAFAETQMPQKAAPGTAETMPPQRSGSDETTGPQRSAGLTDATELKPPTVDPKDPYAATIMPAPGGHAARANEASNIQMEMASRDPREPPVREVCGFKLGKMLGRGGFGKVYLADAPGGVPVAVKIIEAPRDNEAAQRELQSLEAIKTLRHLHLLSVQAFYSLQDQLVIVTELAEGTLRDRMQECKKQGMRGIPLPELIRHMRESAEALDYLHDRKMYHRDIKPENILLVSGHSKVADFGLVRVVQENRAQASVSLTGTLAYMPPEVFRGSVHRNSDQYSLALTYAELRFGQRFVTTHDLVEAMVQHVDGLPDLSAFEPGERVVLQRALAKRPEDRFETCTEFANALDQMSDRTAVNLPSIPQVSAPPKPSGPPLPGSRTPTTSKSQPLSKSSVPELRQKKRRTAGIAMAVAALVVVGIVVAVIATTRGGKKDSGPGGPGVADANWPADVIRPQAKMPIAPAESAQIVTDAGKKYYDKIDLKVDDGTLLRFHFIPKQHGEQDESLNIGPFYMARDKTTYSQFAKFAAIQPPQSSLWEKGAPVEDRHVKNDAFPVFGVLVEDAARFADWLGGELPSLDQWRKAAGFYQPTGREGPFESGFKPGEIAIDRETQGPMPVGAAAKDIGIFGLRDMAGNGLEWTRTIFPEGTVPLRRPPSKFEKVRQVGKNYADGEPLRWDNLQTRSLSGAAYDKPDPYCSFRVVLRVNGE